MPTAESNMMLGILIGSEQRRYSEYGDDVMTSTEACENPRGCAWEGEAHTSGVVSPKGHHIRSDHDCCGEGQVLRGNKDYSRAGSRRTREMKLSRVKLSSRMTLVERKVIRVLLGKVERKQTRQRGA